jgi:hypothetical protein
MKKALVLGAAAMAAMAWAPSADAGDVKLGGYYMGRWQQADSNTTKEVGNNDETERYIHRLQLNMDMTASEKSHAHMRVRVLDSAEIEGADLGMASDGLLPASSNQVVANGNTIDAWEIRQMWLETEAWGIGVKIGEMPLELNDGILVGDDTSSNGGLLLSKTFGGVTAVVGNIRINEDNPNGPSTNSNTIGDRDNSGTWTAGDVMPAAFVNGAQQQQLTLTAGNIQANQARIAAQAVSPLSDGGNAFGANADDSNLWAGALFGKVGIADYNLTVAYADINEGSDFAEVLEGAGLGQQQDSNNLWAALTLSGMVGGVDATATFIYEDGYDIDSDAGVAQKNQFSDDGWLGALRLNGKTSFGGWNGYAFMSSEGFNTITNDNMVWSPTWDMGGPGGQDLLNNWASSTGVSSPSENMTGVGVGLTIKAGGWTIKPMVDYAEVTDATTSNNAMAVYDSAWGGSLLLSTKIQEATTFAIEGAFVDPSASNVATTTSDNMHYVQASIKMDF